MFATRLSLPLCSAQGSWNVFPTRCCEKLRVSRRIEVAEGCGDSSAQFRFARRGERWQEGDSAGRPSMRVCFHSPRTLTETKWASPLLWSLTIILSSEIPWTTVFVIPKMVPNRSATMFLCLRISCALCPRPHVSFLQRRRRARRFKKDSRSSRQSAVPHAIYLNSSQRVRVSGSMAEPSVCRKRWGARNFIHTATSCCMTSELGRAFCVRVCRLKPEDSFVRLLCGESELGKRTANHFCTTVAPRLWKRRS